MRPKSSRVPPIETTWYTSCTCGSKCQCATGSNAWPASSDAAMPQPSGEISTPRTERALTPW
jgi:hypothetical protein